MKFKLEIGNRDLEIEIQNLAERANGSCFLRYGDTLVLATAVMSKYETKGKGFFPLMVEYEERYYAAGKIRGPRYIKRESRPSDKAICNARLIDRAIRPLFPKNLNQEVQVVNTILSWDSQNDPDILGLMASSQALSVSDIPWSGPVSAVRIGRVNDKFILNPTYQEREESQMDLILAGIEQNEQILINMIEGSFEELEENLILEALKFGQPYLKKLIDFQKEIQKKIGKEKFVLQTPATDFELEKEIKEFLAGRLEMALYQKNELKRIDEVNTLKEQLSCFIEEKYPGMGKTSYAQDFFEKEIDRLVHQKVIEEEKRPDGRKLDELREIHCQAGILPRTHGSGLFCRGQTKSLSILTLGTPGDQQLLEGMEIVGKKRFMHHYNFPPYSTGEVKPMRGPGRRDIGHGMLVEKALLPLIPSFEEFPYTIRIVSEILSSNGSTSMAASSSSSLALMDAGVPIKRPVAGIALGLMSDEKDYKILTDIQGPEDHHGDMDFKIAGTEKGVTAIQMDVKIKGITEKILSEALEQGKKARQQILKEMSKVLEKSRSELSPFAPRILTLQINPEKIREVIGPGGKVINEIIEECGVSIDIEDSGKVFVTAEKEEAVKKASAWIKNITREVKVGEVFQGKIKRILDFGAFVEILPGQEGLVHISQLAPFRVRKVEDVVKIGDIVPVKVISIDTQGRINLSLKEVKPLHQRFDDRSKRNYERRK
ncbi:MAG: polyribonucleotide nucleotidyltransferase [Patescibacteria group bacterium]|nr:polyribonucleotide nucleotidyltransferase [Patescibacteria group bacterium]